MSGLDGKRAGLASTDLQVFRNNEKWTEHCCSAHLFDASMTVRVHFETFGVTTTDADTRLQCDAVEQITRGLLDYSSAGQIILLTR